ncbi:DUF58 domain-containing protein [Alloscardovia omnicolens]|uniref:DUF58 domain-containing protein n=1 Tax=Alloscardovia omnicolens TaxID=419015 RepID=UPI0040557897
MTHQKHVDPIRRKIETLGSRLSLPIVHKAMGIMEGEHPTHRRGSGDEFLDLRPYIIGDEARSIDWKASARSGLPIVVSREHNATSNVWMIIDAGRQLLGSTPAGERHIDVAMNAVRMFSMLSLKRGDNVNFVLGDSHSITRMPFTGGYEQCDALLEQISHHDFPYSSDWDAMLDYAVHLRDKYSLMILITRDKAWSSAALHRVSILSQTHPVVVVNISSANPFESSAHFHSIYAEDSTRNHIMAKIPAFMRHSAVSTEVAISRQLSADELHHRLAKTGATLFHAESNESMFSDFIHRISQTQRSPHFGVQPSPVSTSAR